MSAAVFVKNLQSKDTFPEYINVKKYKRYFQNEQSKEKALKADITEGQLSYTARDLLYSGQDCYHRLDGIT